VLPSVGNPPYTSPLNASFTVKRGVQDAGIVRRCVQYMHLPRSRSDSFDLIVVGAGPSGSMAALSAQRRGMKTLLLEREEEVGGNVICGEGVSSWIFKDFLEFNPRWICSKITGAVFRLQDVREFMVSFPDAGWILNRKNLDEGLSRIAATSGVTVLTGALASAPIMQGDKLIGVTVALGRSERHYFAPIVIGADGISSAVGRWVSMDTALGLREIASCAQWLVRSSEIPQNRVEFVVGRQIAPGGYAWVFPKGGGAANVGVGISPLCSRRKAVDFLGDFVSHRFTDAKVLEQKSGGVSGAFKGELARENVLLCGDAARVGDPLSGAGIYNALATGALAGQTAAEMESTELSTRYRKRVLKKFGRQLRMSEELRRIYLELDDDQLQELWQFGERRFSGRTIREVHFFTTVCSLVCTHPKYTRYIPRLAKAGFHMSKTI